MKPGIHPECKPAVISCACGASFETSSTQGDYKIEICSQCHPFFTGRQKLVDSEGRVERFRKKYAHLQAAAGKKEAKQEKPAEAEAKAEEAKPEETK